MSENWIGSTMYGKWIQSVAAKADNNASNSIKIKSKLSLQFTCKLNAFQDQKGDEMSDGYGNFARNLR